jgi:hypothetical protein
MTKTVSEILFAAADLIEPEGAWTQRRFGSREAGCYCIMGALHQHRWDAGLEFDDGVRAPALYLEGFLGEIVAHWNDARGRTQAEVVAKLREAAEKAREQGL